MDLHKARVKSAPPLRTSRQNDVDAKFRTAANVVKFVSKLQLGGQKTSDVNSGGINCLTFDETVNKLRTAMRVAQRFKERRRTESDITIYTKPSALLANEMMARKMSQQELEMSLTRTCRPTASFLARAASCRRINSGDIYVPPPFSHVQYFTIGTGRFKGDRPLKEKEVDSLIRRLSTYNPRRGPAESMRVLPKETKRQLGPLGSYRWSGVRNC